MRNNNHSRFGTVGRIGVALAAPVLLIAGVLTVPAGAANPGPYATTVTVTSSPSIPVTGQPVTLTAKVGAGSPSRIPVGQVQFTITGNDTVTTVSCDAANPATLSCHPMSVTVCGS